MVSAWKGKSKRSTSSQSSHSSNGSSAGGSSNGSTAEEKSNDSRVANALSKLRQRQDAIIARKRQSKASKENAVNGTGLPVDTTTNNNSNKSNNDDVDTTLLKENNGTTTAVNSKKTGTAISKRSSTNKVSNKKKTDVESTIIPENQAIQPATTGWLCGPDSSLDTAAYLYGGDGKKAMEPKGKSSTLHRGNKSKQDTPPAISQDHTFDDTAYTDFTDDDTFTDMTLTSTKEPTLLNHGIMGIGELFGGDLFAAATGTRAILAEPRTSKSNGGTSSSKRRHKRNSSTEDVVVISDVDSMTPSTIREDVKEDLNDDPRRPRSNSPSATSITPSVTPSVASSYVGGEGKPVILEEFWKSRAVPSSGGVELTRHKVTRIEI